MTEPSFDATSSEVEAYDVQCSTDASRLIVPKVSQMESLSRGEEHSSEQSLALEANGRQQEGISADGMRSSPVKSERIASLGYRSGFFLASMVGGLSSVCIKQLLLPIQVGILDPTNTATSFALVASLGALAGLSASPLTGALSDRTTSRWGRRRPWIIVGIVIAVIGLLMVAQATTILWLLLGEILAQIGVDSLLSTVTALIPDHIPQERRAGAAALNGMAPIVGGVIGLVMVTRFTNTRLVWQGYLLLAALSILFILVFLLVLREPPIRQQEMSSFRWLVFFLSFLVVLGAAYF